MSNRRKIKKKKIKFYGSTKDGRSRTEYTDGSVEIGMNDEMVKLLKEQLKFFKEKFGREPRPNEPIFFDPDFDEPTEYSNEKFDNILITAMKKAGTRPEFIYAYQKTGMMLSETNIELASPEDIEEWGNAIEEYRANHKEYH